MTLLVVHGSQGTGHPQGAASAAVSEGWSPYEALRLVNFANGVEVQMIPTWQQCYGSRLLH